MRFYPETNDDDKHIGPTQYQLDEWAKREAVIKRVGAREALEKARKRVANVARVRDAVAILDRLIAEAG